MSPSIQIVFFNPTKKYLAGDFVYGKVTLSSSEPMSARFLRVSWKGVTKCEFGTSKTDRTQIHISNYFFGWIADGKETQIPAGTHGWRFRFRLPNDCPPSFHGISNFGKTKYKVCVELDRAWRLNVVAKKEFTVIQKTNVTLNNTEMLIPSEFKHFRTSGTLFKDGLIAIKLNFAKRVFVPGESAKVLVTMENYSTKPITQLHFELLQQSHYHSRPQRRPCSVIKCFEECPLDAKLRRNGEKVLSGANYSCHVAPNELKEVSLEIEIPKGIPASFESPIISMGYLLVFWMKNESISRNRVMCSARIAIDNVESGNGFCKDSFGFCNERKSAPPPYLP